MLKWKFIKFLMEILKQQVNSSSNLASSFIVTTHNTPVNFNFIRSLLWRKWSHQCSNFETCKYSGEKVPYYSCHFPNHKSVFLQILHDCSVPWKITLYGLGHTLHTFHKKNKSKWEFWEFSVLRSNFTKSLSCLKLQISFSLYFASPFSVMRYNSSILF